MLMIATASLFIAFNNARAVLFLVYTQNCTNTIGRFVCGCTSGYRLGSDDFNCEGIIVAYIYTVN